MIEIDKQYLKYIILFLTIFTIHVLFSNFVKRQIIVKGVSEDAVYFGQTVNLKDKEALSYSNGFVVAFNTANLAGGINGKYINLLIYDDDYRVKKAIINARLLLDYQNVLALIGTWGTPTTIGIMNDVIKDKDIPLISPLTGTNILYQNFDRRVILTRNSYKNEINTILKHANSKGKMNLGIIYQNDEYGIGCFSDLTDCIIDNNYNIKIAAATSYERNSRFYYPGLKKLFNVEPYDFTKIKEQVILNQIDCVILFCTTVQKTKFIEYFKRIKPDLFIYTVSLSGYLSSDLVKKANTDNIYYTDIYPDIKSVYPKAYKTIQTEIAEYNKTVKNSKNILTFNYEIFDGWVAGKLICQVLKEIQPKNINRESFIDTVYKIKNFKIDDYTLGPYINEKNNVGTKSVYLYKFNNKTIKYDLINKYKSDY